MEKHHKLRRPQGSSIHGCNICGKEGHQAANCTNGTVDWGRKWGASAFQLEASYEAPREPDYADIAAQARAFAAKKLAEEEAKRKAEERGKADNKGDVDKKEETAPGTEEEGTAPGTESESGGKKRRRDNHEDEEESVREEKLAKDPRKDSTGKETAEDAKDTRANAPASTTYQTPHPQDVNSAWRVYYDQLGRPYYHNSVTGVTQWTAPVVTAPPSIPPPVPPRA